MTIKPEIYLSITALAIAALSFIVSALSLGWNIYRDVILKPRLKVHLSFCYLIHESLPKSAKKLILTATNFGPRELSCNMICLKTSSWWRCLLRKTKNGILNEDKNDMFCDPLPKTLNVGEKINLILVHNEFCFLKDDYTHIGLIDSFGRIHWAPKKDVTKARKSFRKKLDKIED